MGRVKECELYKFLIILISWLNIKLKYKVKVLVYREDFIV